MKKRCQCGEVIENFDSYHCEADQFNAFHFLCEKCQSTFTTIVYQNGKEISLNGYLGDVFHHASSLNIE